MYAPGVLLVGALLAFLILEAALRLYRLRLAPLRLRILHAGFLLNGESLEAVTEVHQRVQRAGLGSFDELFRLYAQASGKSVGDIERLFGFRMSWLSLLRSKLVLRNHLRWHLGLVPLPNQRLRTVTITEAGLRATGAPPDPASASRPVRQVILTGGSVSYGYGATSDAATIAGRLEHYLNARDPSATHRWQVLNYGFPAATSFQELIAVLQAHDLPEGGRYLVSLSGCNDVDQQFGQAMPNVSGLAQAYSESLQRKGAMARAAAATARRLALVMVLRRFLEAYRQWPGPAGRATSQRAAGGRPFQAEIDQPDIYPLW